MAIISWDDKLSVNVNEIDGQHKKLIDMLNYLNDAMKAGQAKDVLGRILDGLISYTAHHFGTEEKHMVATNFPDYAAHKAEHEQFVTKVLEFKQGFDEGNAFVTMEIMQFLCDWVSKHILGTDKKYVPHFNGNGIS